ncbi:MAG: acetyl-CoA decarbonylase/synthase complex subunit gamma [Candidatus Bathyarchaeia archaeon]
MSKKSISPIQIYKLLPKTNCKECGEDNCMAFAAKVANRELEIDACPPLLTDQHSQAYKSLWELLKPPVRKVTIGAGDNEIAVGGELVMYRHELTYFNPTKIAVDVTDQMSEEELLARVKRIEDFAYEYMGQVLKLDMIAVRSTSNDGFQFSKVVRLLTDNTKLPLILCSLNPTVLDRGLEEAKDRKPLIYAATLDNWREVMNLTLKHRCPLTVSSPFNLDGLRSLTRTAKEIGVEDIVLDPGSFWNGGIPETVNNFTMIRRAACKAEDELSGYPLMGIPAAVWTQNEETPEIIKWKEACLGSVLITRYADLLIVHSLEGWALLPLVILRQNIYNDPRKPVSVDPGLKTFGAPDEASPVLFTTNFALTYYTVASDLESSGVSCYLMIVDTEGLSIESAVAGRKLTADKVADALREMNVGEKVKHRKLIIPGRASRLSGEIEEATQWQVLVGPMDSSGIAKFLQEKWC